MEEHNGGGVGAQECRDWLLSALPDAVVVISLRDGGEHVVSKANEAACELLGYSREAMEGLSALDLLAPERYDFVDEAVEQLRTRRSMLLETVLLTRDGIKVPAEVNASICRSAGSESIIVVCRDISLRKLVMDALDAAQENYRMIFEMAAKGVFQSTLGGRFIKVNPAMADILGYKSPEALVLGVTDLGKQVYVDPDARRKYLAQLHEQGEVRHFEARYLRADGRIIWVSLTARLVSGESDLDSYIEGFCEDITDLKEAERRLKDSEELHRITLASLGDTVFITRDDGGFTYVSPNTVAMFGLEPEQVMALESVDELLGDSLFEASELERVGELTNLEVTITVPGGSDRALLVSVKLVDIRGGTRLYVCHDVTEHRMLRAEAMRAAHLASLGELAAGVAHEINNPVNGIMLYAELLEEHAELLGDNSDVPERIITQSERVAAIVRNLLAFSRKPEAAYGPVNVAEILEDSLGLTRVHLLKGHVLLDVDVPEGLPRIRGRDQEIQQVFVNLISNARDALNARFKDRDPGKKLDISLSHHGQDGQRFVRAEIHDRGAGIPEAILSRIFDPFFSTKPKSYGTGLGLSTTHKIISEMGATIRFDSVEGEYTRVEVDFPVWDGR